MMILSTRCQLTVKLITMAMTKMTSSVSMSAYSEVDNNDDVIGKYVSMQ